MTDSEMSIFIRAHDKASEVIDGIKHKTGEAGGLIEKHWKTATVALAGAGVGLEAYARTQAPLTEQTRKLATQLGMTEEEIRKLAVSTSDVTFPLEDVLDLMEQGRTQGLRSAEQLQEYALFWDMVGDATGESATALAEAGVAFRALGIDAGNESEALAAFGYITSETTNDIGDFLTFIERTGPELREMNMDVNDAAAVMGVLEKEFGMTSRVARTEFRKAVGEAEGDINELYSALGITEEQMGKYRAEVLASGGTIEEFADMHAESYTILQKLQHRLSEAQYELGKYASVAGDIAPIMMAMGPAMKGVTVIKGLFTAATLAGTKATLAFAAAQLVALAPILLIIAAIVAAVAIGWYLYKNWDEIGDKIVGVWETTKDFLSNIWDTIIDVFTNNFDKILLILFPPVGLALLVMQNWGKIVGAVSGIWENLIPIFTNMGKDALNAGINIVRGLWDGIWSLDAWIRDKVRNFARGIFNSIRDGLGSLWPFSPSEAGVDIGEGLATGIEKGIRIAKGHLTDGTSMIKSELAIDGERDLNTGFASSIGGSSAIHNHFDGNYYIREESDIKKIAQELFILQSRNARARGV